MKKSLSVILIALAVISCKKEGDKNDVTTVETDSTNVTLNAENIEPIAEDSLCATYFDTLVTMTTSEQVQWLRDNQNEICHDFIRCIEPLHKMNKQAYNEAVRIHWGSTSEVYTEITMGDILENTSCDYNKYIKFSEDKNNHITFTHTDTFTNSGVASCYSVPFFKSIMENNSSVDDKTVLKFTKAKVGPNETIVFTIDGMTNGYFDYSRIPPK